MPPPLTFYPKPSRQVGLLVIAMAFVAGGIWVGIEGQWLGYLIAALFSLGIPIALINMLPGSAFLHLDGDGLTFCSAFRKHSIAWSDIDAFFVVAIRQYRLKTHEMVGFNYVPAYDRSRTGRALSKMIADCEGALPETYGKEASDLADLLNAWLQDARA